MVRYRQVTATSFVDMTLTRFNDTVILAIYYLFICEIHISVCVLQNISLLRHFGLYMSSSSLANCDWLLIQLFEFILVFFQYKVSSPEHPNLEEFFPKFSQYHVPETHRDEETAPGANPDYLRAKYFIRDLFLGASLTCVGTDPQRCVFSTLKAAIFIPRREK